MGEDGSALRMEGTSLRKPLTGRGSTLKARRRCTRSEESFSTRGARSRGRSSAVTVPALATTRAVAPTKALRAFVKTLTCCPSQRSTNRITWNCKWGGNRRTATLLRRSGGEAEVHHVPVADDVLLPFEAHLAGLFGTGFPAERDVV